MTLIEPPPRAPGETPGLACWTGQRRRLGAVPFLKALPWLQVEYRMCQLEVDDASLWSRVPQGTRIICQHQHFPDNSTPVPVKAMLLTCRLLGTTGVTV
jgi:hypothetical protein